MTEQIKFRKMKPYYPRRNSKDLQIHKQKLQDLEHRLKADLGEFLVFLREGTAEKVSQSALKARDDWHKWGPEMQNIASALGLPFPKAVYAFLDSMDKLLRAQEMSTPSPFYLWIDEAKIRACYAATVKLESLLFRGKPHTFEWQG